MRRAILLYNEPTKTLKLPRSSMPPQAETTISLWFMDVYGRYTYNYTVIGHGDVVIIE